MSFQAGVSGLWRDLFVLRSLLSDISLLKENIYGITDYAAKEYLDETRFVFP